MTTDDTLALIDRMFEDNQRQTAALLELRAAVASERGSKPDPEPELGGSDDFPAFDLIDTATAEERFNIPRDRLARWCRETEGHGDHALGTKVGGRWQVSISRLRALKL